MTNFAKSYFDLHFSIAEAGNTPIHFLRYEDLAENPKYVLTELFKFILEIETLEGTNIERRIEEVLSKGHSATKLYDLKQIDKKVNKYNKHFHRYSEEQIKRVKKELSKMIHFFGYDQREGEQNPFGFFEYEEGEAPTEHLSLKDKFKEVNKQSL